MGLESVVGTLSFDTIASKIFRIGRPNEHETQTHVEVPEPLIERRFHSYSGITKQLFSYEGEELTATILVPGWNNNDGHHTFLIPMAQKEGHVVEFLWQKEAISADTNMTAESFSRMSDYVANSLKVLHSSSSNVSQSNFTSITV